MSEKISLTMQVNGQSQQMQVDPRVTLLDALREHLNLTGTKKGCDQGQCGACTVLINGQRVLSCLTLAAQADGAEVTSIEGLASTEGELHPVQRCFMENDAFQCGYCTPGQIMSAVALLKEPGGADDAAVKELMSGNICCCGDYANIVSAIQQVRKQNG